MSNYVQITTTTPSREDAARIADLLIGRKLAACVQIIDTIDSIYWWDGKVEKATEWLCAVKTEKRLFAEVEAAIKDVHPYDVPEIIAFEVAAGSDDYLAWISRELRQDGKSNP